MAKILVLVFGLILSLTSFAWATPPGDIVLDYRPQSKTLHVEAPHPTDRQDRHYIRRMSVILNQKPAQEFYFTRQTAPNKFSTDIDLELNAGDHLEVQLWCSQGGTRKAVLDIPAPQGEAQTLPSAQP